MTRRSAGEGLLRQRPNGLWEARYVAADGRKHSIYAKTKRDVSDRLRDALRDAETGLRPLDKRLSTGKYLDDWLERQVKPNVRPRTVESYAFVVTAYLKPALGHVPLASLQPEHVQAMLRGLGKRKPGLSATTVRYAYVVLRIALGRALKLGKVHRNVATLIDPPKRAERKVTPLSAEDARAFMEAVSSDPLGPLYRLALSTGMRQGELLALRWQDIDLDAGVLEVRHTLQRGARTLAAPKTESARRHIAVDDDTKEMLRVHRLAQAAVKVPEHDRDYVFRTREGDPLHARNLLTAYHAALVRAGLSPRPFHQLRHGFATLMLESGEELANVSKVLGHSTFATTVDFYGHLTPAISRRAAERMRRILAG